MKTHSGEHTMKSLHALRTPLAALLLVLQALAWAGSERVTVVRTNGSSVFANLVDPSTQSSGFVTVSRDAVAGSTALDFAWATPVPGDPRHVVLVQGAGEIPNGAFTVGRDGAQLNLVTPFETVRCLVDIEDGTFDCTGAPALAFELSWTRNGFETLWEQRVSDYRLGPLQVRQQGQFEERSATVTGTFGGFPTSGGVGKLIDTRGASATREVRMKSTP
jgi:hypothetical protein